MCELASQAYDWVDPSITHEVSLEKRFFKFPSWVVPTVKTGPNKVASQGEGCLVVGDPLRIDYYYQIRTQDIVRLEADGRFKLLERVPYSPLRGCSLNVQDMANYDRVKPANELQIAAANNCRPFSPTSGQTLNKRVVHLENMLYETLDNTHFLQMTAKQLVSKNIAVSAFNDIRAGMPKNLLEWKEALNNSISSNTPETWLIILPGSHIQAIFHPLSLGYLAGLKLYVRKTTDSNDCAEAFLLDKFQSLEDSKIILLPKSFRIGSSLLPHDVQALSIFGDDDTVRSISKISGLPTIGFGNSICCILVTVEEALSNPAKLIKDSFSLAQLGCFSSRFILITGNIKKDDPKNLQEILTGKSREFIGGCFPTSIRAALDHEYLHQQLKGAYLIKRKDFDQPIFPSYYFASIDDFEINLCQRQFVVPLIFIPEVPFDKILHHLNKKMPSLKKISICPSKFELLSNDYKLLAGTSNKISFCPLGFANTPKWDGKHESIPVFRFT
ncbi:MAG: hypothetical protein HQK54_00445 [Oligoflexales bacterium]|nr:hypothetical protein [Oligoflexales bacterium]